MNLLLPLIQFNFSSCIVQVHSTYATLSDNKLKVAKQNFEKVVLQFDMQHTTNVSRVSSHEVAGLRGLAIRRVSHMIHCDSQKALEG